MIKKINGLSHGFSTSVLQSWGNLCGKLPSSPKCLFVFKVSCQSSCTHYPTLLHATYLSSLLSLLSMDTCNTMEEIAYRRQKFTWFWQREKKQKPNTHLKVANAQTAAHRWGMNVTNESTRKLLLGTWNILKSQRYSFLLNFMEGVWSFFDIMLKYV